MPEGRLCSLEVVQVAEVMQRVLLCTLQAVDGRLCSLEVLEMLEVMRCMLLRMLDAVEGGSATVCSEAKLPGLHNQVVEKSSQQCIELARLTTETTPPRSKEVIPDRRYRLLY